MYCVFYSYFLKGFKDVQFESESFSVLSLFLTDSNFKGPICEHTQGPLEWAVFSLPCFHCLSSCYLPLQATRRTPVGILAHLLMPAGRLGTSKCAARCASPAQWDILCMAQQRGSASPTGPGRADSRFASVRGTLNMFLFSKY